ncbi:MAG: hypothetical protein NTZ90_15965 [Proteobacteria bacterium]|nr:hypothetical protein [Pseudomonadota bacterium]
MKIMVRYLTICAAMLSGCVTTRHAGPMPEAGPARCDYIKNEVDWDDQIQTLNHISELFQNSCFHETIAIGSKAREDYSHKTYSLMRETAELFVAEGTVTDYVLESYERGYLTFLISLSYLRLHQVDDASVELNKLYSEEVAAVYNHGQDPVNALLQAVLWENDPREGFSARPFWLWLSKAESTSQELRTFALHQVRAIDAKVKRAPWRVDAIGHFPALDWSMNFMDSTNGYFTIRPKRPFDPPCVDTTGILVPTTSWFHKIAIRHSHNYHPLLHAKSWIRMPFGVVYSISTAAAGAGIMVGGCALDAAHKDGGALCHLSIEGGAAVMAKSVDVADYTLRPDLRHWENVPAAIYISTGTGPKDRRCAAKAEALGVQRLL